MAKGRKQEAQPCAQSDRKSVLYRKAHFLSNCATKGRIEDTAESMAGGGRLQAECYLCKRMEKEDGKK